MFGEFYNGHSYQIYIINFNKVDGDIILKILRIRYIYNNMYKSSKIAEKQDIKHKNIEVAVRMRPILQQFQDEQVWTTDSHTNTIQSLSTINQSFALNNITNMSSNSINLPKKTSKNYKTNSTLGVQKNNTYQFSCDYAFGPEHQNKEVYLKCCQKIIKQFIQNQKNGTIFMYGQTTSGKTYTMLGDQYVEGIITYSLKDICTELENKQNTKLNISYFQIYNEQINDLLHSGSVNLKIVDDKVYGAQQCTFETFQDALDVLKQGQQQRSYGQKKFHDHSSRSHTIFQIKLRNQNTGQQKAILNLVDLAGSERLTDQEANQETGYINKSLFVLSNVINRLASGKKNMHIPFRDSKLTRILAPSLTGNSSTSVICTISPASINFYQTLSTLRFASCSRKIKLKPKSISESREQSMCIQKSTQNKRLQKQNEQLKKMIKQLTKQKTKDGNFLVNKMLDIQKQLQEDPILCAKTTGNKQWKPKVQMLCKEYNKNILTLQKQYTKAMINAISIQCNIDRQKLIWATQQFNDI